MSWKADVFQDIIVSSDLSGLKRFPADKLFILNNLSVKRAYFTDKLGLGDCLHDLSPSAVTYQ